MNDLRTDKGLQGADRQGEQAAKTFMDETSGTQELLTIPERLYGRDREMVTLLESFERERNCWQWRREKIGQMEIPDHVVGLFVLKLRRLNDARRNLLSLAACLGNRFDLPTLSIISGCPIAECLALLGSRDIKPLLRPLEVGGGGFPAKDIRGSEEWVFLHDRIQQAANRFLETPGLAAQLGRDHHELILQLFKERAGCEFLNGNLNEAAECVQKAVAHARTAIERADALNILIVQNTLLARYPEAIAAGRQALAALALSLPENEFEAARDEEIAQVREALRHRSVASLFELPVMSDPEMLMAAKILITMGPPCYRSHQRLWSVIVPRVVNLTLRHGNIPQVGYSHTAFGGLLGWVNNDYATAREFGELATRLMTGTFRAPSDQSVFYLMIGSSIRHWFQHLRHGTQDYKDAYDIGLRSGNLQYAAYAFGHDMYCRFYQGVPLKGLIQEAQRSLAFSQTRHNQWAIDLLEGGLNIFGQLAGDAPAANGNVAWLEAEYLQRVESHQNIQVTCIYKVLKTFALLVTGQHAAALALSDETEPLIYTVGTQGLLPWPEHVVARVLILTALFSNADHQQQSHRRAELDRMLVQLRIWADHCPENFQHKYLLAAAELARIDNRPIAAMELYGRAVEAAQAGAFRQWEGLANERAHDFWMERGQERLAQVYWQQAYVCFHRWGAGAKVAAMETAYRALVAKTLPAAAGSGEPAEREEPAIAAALAERQINQLRNHAFHMQQSTLRVEAETQADELAQAMQRVCVEVAERKRTEVKLRLLSQAMEQSPASVVITDTVGNIEYVNPKFIRVTGYTLAEVLGKNPRVLKSNETSSEAYRKMWQTITAGKEWHGEFHNHKKNGELYWESASISPVRDLAGHITHYLAVKEDITERKRAQAELEQIHKQLVDVSRRSGMAEIATNVLHNVGNVLNSVNVSANCLAGNLRQSKVASLPRVAALLQEHETDLAAFLSADPRGSQFPGYLAQLATHLVGEQAAALKELADLQKNIEHIKEIVAMQQSYATFGGVKEIINVLDLVEDSLRINEGALSNHGVEVIREFEPVPPLNVEKHKLLQILVNLLSNAKHACQDSQHADRRLTVRVAHRDGRVKIAVIDNGIGIPLENLTRIFNHGFTTRKSGHGFGLHSGALATMEMGGSLTVHSDGPGQGATFTLDLPLSDTEERT
jgi:PAS domain S-box-containing protein